MATYYIVENNQQAGPFTLDQLAAKGITPETNVWTEGMSSWTPASQVSELQSLFAPQPEYAPQPQYTPQPEPEPQPDYSSSYSSSEEQAPAMPKDWKVPSIILIAVSIFCCGLCAGIVNLALGVMALLESNKIEGFYRQGNYAEAQAASDKAGKYVKIGGIVFGVGIVLEIIFWIIYIIIGVANN